MHFDTVVIRLPRLSLQGQGREYWLREVLAYVNQLRPLAENEDFLEAIVSFNGVSRSFIDSFRAVTTKLNKARAADLQRILAMPREQVEAVLANARDSNAGREDSNLQEPPVKHSDDPLKQIPSHIKQLIILNRHAILSPYRDCDAIYSTSRYTLKQACFLMLVLRFAPLPKVVEMMDKPAISVQELTILLELSPTAICFYNMYSDLVSKLMNPNPFAA